MDGGSGGGPAASRATRLLEREPELLRFDEFLRDLHASRGRVLVVSGPSGIGKTSLLRELADCAQETGVLALGARVADLERGAPLGAVRQIMEPVVRPSGDAPAAANAPGWIFNCSAVGLGPEALHDLYWCLVDLAGQRPLLLIVDDVQRTDAESLRFLVYLAARIEWLPIALALSQRAGEPPTSPPLLQELLSDSQVEELRPRPLSMAALQRLAEDLMRGPPHPDFVAACHAVTCGNPLFAAELLRELQADGVAPTSAGAEAVRRTGPRAVARSVLVPVSRLSSDAVAYARAAAVLGDGCSHADACALAGLPAEAADVAVDALVEAYVLEPSSGLRFRHPIVRTAIHDDLPPREIAAAHARAAEILIDRGADPDVVAYHLVSSRPRGDPATAERLHAAAGRALVRGAPEIAERYLRRALEEPPPHERRPGLLHDLADALLRMGSPAAVDWVDRTLTMDLEPERRAGLLQRTAGLMALRGRRTATVDALLCETAAQAVLMAMLEERPAHELGELALKAMSGPDMLGPVALEGPGVAVCTAAAIVADRDGDLRDRIDHATELSLARGSVPGMATAFGARATLRLAGGLLAGAETDVNAATTAARAARLEVVLPFLAAVQALIRLEREGPQAAWEVAGDLGFDSSDGTIPFLTRLLEVRGALHLAAGRPREALADAEGAGATPGPYGRWRGLAAAAHLALGDLEAAADLAQRELERARRLGSPREIGSALRVLARVVGGTEAESILREAITVLERSHGRLELARALVDLGAQLRRENQRARARPELHRGQALAVHCGATVLATRAGDELAATGARSRVADAAALDRLTASERRAAELAAGGRSNPQIAAELVITRKTVELHLSNAYRKLGIRSRAELADALRR